jgi:zinc transport system substrate-binding protein
VRHRLILALLLVGLGCGAGSAREPAPTELVLAASIPPHAWLIEQIGGGRVTVHTLLRPGESPTTHQPSDVQVSVVVSAKVFFRCGVPFESGAWFRALEGELEIVDLRDGVATRRMAHHHDHEGVHADDEGIDPHTWLSPSRLAVQARSVAAVLQRLDPDHRDEYATRLDHVLADLDALDTRLAATLAPYRGRSFVVFHPSWGYFADDYGLEQLAIEIEGKEPTDAELTRIQQRARALDVSVVFVQPQIAGRSARAVAGALDARLETLDPLAPDVISNLRHAADAIVGGFGG